MNICYYCVHFIVEYPAQNTGSVSGRAEIKKAVIMAQFHTFVLSPEHLLPLTCGYHDVMNMFEQLMVPWLTQIRLL